MVVRQMEYEHGVRFLSSGLVYVCDCCDPSPQACLTAAVRPNCPPDYRTKLEHCQGFSAMDLAAGFPPREG